MDDARNDLGPGFVFKGRYEIVNPLGEGGQGLVYLVKDKQEKTKKALKMIEKHLYETQNEINLLKTLSDAKNNKIIRYFDDFSFMNLKHCVLTEYCEKGDLSDFIKSHKSRMKRIEIDIIKKYMYEIALGIQFLHRRMIIHRDIKPSNIFLTDRGVKIGDLGDCITTENFEKNTTSRAGTLSNMSPELVNGAKKYTNKIDIWAYGCTIFELAYLKKLFDNDDYYEVRKKITDSELTIEHQNPKIKRVLKSCLKRNFELRPTIEDVIEMIDETTNIIIENRPLNQQINSQINPQLIPQINTQIKRETCLISGSTDESVRIYDLDTGEVIQTHSLKGMYNICVSKDKVLAACNDGKIKVWNINKRCFGDHLEGNMYKIKSMTAFDDMLFASCAENLIYVWNLTSSALMFNLSGHNRGIGCLLVSNGYLLSGSDDCSIKRWNLREQTRITLDKIYDGHYDKVNCLAANETHLFSGSSDKSILIWSFEDARLVRKLEQNNSVKCLALYSNWVISGSENKITVWDYKQSSKLFRLKEHSNFIRSLFVYNDKLYSGSNDKTIKVWNVNAGKCTNTIKEHRDSVIFIDKIEL